MTGRPAYVTQGRRTEGGGFGVEVQGLPEVQALLAGYQGAELDAKMKAGLKAAGSIFRQSIRQAAPGSVRAGVRPGFKKGGEHRAGDLYKSIGYRVLRGASLAVAVGPVGKHSGMRHLAIRPTRAHRITSVHGWLWINGQYTVIAHHPGNASHPWVAAGVAAGRARAVDVAGNAIWQDVRKDVAAGTFPDEEF